MQTSWTVIICLLCFLSMTNYSMSTTGTLSDYLLEREATLVNLCTEYKHVLHSRKVAKSCRYTDACGEIPNTSCNSNFGSDISCSCSGELINLNDTVVLPGISGKSPSSFACYGQAMLPTFQSNAAQVQDLKWQFVESVDGMAWYPAVSFGQKISGECKHRSECIAYNVAQNSFYTSAISGKRRVILAFDVTGTMMDSHRLTKAKVAGIQIINSLSFIDDVAVFGFSGTVQSCAFAAGKLLQATSDNKELFVKCIQSLSIDNTYQSLKVPINTTFNILDGSDAANCMTTVILITDSWKYDLHDEVKSVEYFHSRNKHHGARLLAYTIEGGNPSVVHEIACKNRGTWTELDDQTDFSVIVNYYQYFADRSTITKPVWSEPYADPLGLGTVVTVTQACYSRAGHAIAVAGTVVPFSNLLSFVNDTDYITSFLYNRSATGHPSIHGETLNDIRGGKCNYCKKFCGDNRIIILVTIAGFIFISILIIIVSAAVYFQKDPEGSKWGKKIKSGALYESSHDESFHRDSLKGLN